MPKLVDHVSSLVKLWLPYKSVYKFPKCQKIHFKKWTKLVKLTCKEIIGIFAIYLFRLLRCLRQNRHLYLLMYTLSCQKLMISPMAPHHLECVVWWEVVSVMWWWCVVSLWVSEHNSTTRRSYGDVNISACCCRRGESILKGIRFTRVSLIREKYKFQCKDLIIHRTYIRIYMVEY